MSFLLTALPDSCIQAVCFSYDYNRPYALNAYCRLPTAGVYSLAIGLGFLLPGLSDQLAVCLHGCQMPGLPDAWLPVTGGLVNALTIR